MPRHEFIPTPYRRLVTLSVDDFVREGIDDDEVLLLDAEMEEAVTDAIVRLELPPDSQITIAQALKAIEGAGCFEARVTQARAESERRRDTGVTHAQPLVEQIRAFLVQRPELHPLTEPIIAEALKVEAAAEGAAS